MTERLDAGSDTALDRAAAAIDAGTLVVYPTETVYGLGADALDAAAIEAVFEAKGRDRDDPISLAVPSVEAAMDYVSAAPIEREFMEAFLPGPVTVVLEKRDRVPDALTGGRDRVGVRIPDHERALALLERTAPITATSANVSGRPSITDPADLEQALLDHVEVVLDGGVAPGTGSTVVTVADGTIHRRGQGADAIEAWLAEHL
jgi:L-threonylcarbamoyladenylate synthase